MKRRIALKCPVPPASAPPGPGVVLLAAIAGDVPDRAFDALHCNQSSSEVKLRHAVITSDAMLLEERVISQVSFNSGPSFIEDNEMFFNVG